MEKKYIYIGGAAVLGLGAYLWYSGHVAAENAAAEQASVDANAAQSPSMLYEPASAVGGTDQVTGANGSSGGTDSGSLAAVGGTSTASDSDIVSLLGQQIAGQNANQALALNLQASVQNNAISTGLQSSDAGYLAQLLASLSGRATGVNLTNSSNGVSITLAGLQNQDATVSPVNAVINSAASTNLTFSNGMSPSEYLNNWYNGQYTPNTNLPATSSQLLGTSQSSGGPVAGTYSGPTVTGSTGSTQSIINQILKQ